MGKIIHTTNLSALESSGTIADTDIMLVQKPTGLAVKAALTDIKAYIGGGSAGVQKIIAGTNVTISPTSGTGNVTISASGGGSGGTDANAVHYTADSGKTADQKTQARTNIGAAASSHTHANSDLTGLADWAKASKKPTYTAADVGAVQNVANASGIKVVSSSTEIVSTTDNILYFVTGS